MGPEASSRQAVCVPRLCGIGFHHRPESLLDRNRAALQKLMLFKPLSLPDDVCKYDGTAVLELLGDECDIGDLGFLNYEPA